MPCRHQFLGANLCIRHHNMAQTCASCINIATGCGCIPMTQDEHHASIWLNTAWLITLNLLHHTLFTSFFATLYGSIFFDTCMCILCTFLLLCMAQYIMTKLTTSYFVHLLFCYFVEEEQNCILAGCCFAALVLLTGDFGGLISEGSTQKG